MSATVARLYRYPVKGLGAEPLAHADVARGAGMPNDRRWAIAPGRTTYDDAHPVWMRKEAFVMLTRDGDERLAALRCAFEDDGARAGGDAAEWAVLARGPATADGRRGATAAIAAFLGPRPDGAVRVVPAGSLSLTDIPQNGLSVINLASVDDFAQRIGRPVDPLRFRANVYVAGLPAWAERAWIGRRIAIGSRSSRSTRTSSAARRRRSIRRPPPATSTPCGCCASTTGTSTWASTPRSSRVAASPWATPWRPRRLRWRPHRGSAARSST